MSWGDRGDVGLRWCGVAIIFRRHETSLNRRGSVPRVTNFYKLNTISGADLYKVSSVQLDLVV